MSTPTTTTTPNLRESRKEMAAAKKAAAAAKPAAKPATAKPATAKPAATAAATKAAAKPAAKQATPKLKWTLLGERDEKGRVACTAAGGGREYAISGGGDSWRAVHKRGKAETVLAEGSFGKCYNAVVAHNKAAK
jgi:hypothetical protein